MKRLLLLCSALVLGCQVSGADPAAEAANAVSAARGAGHYQELCAACHGADMTGGQAGSLTDDTWTYGSADDDILGAISEGIDAAGMPAFGDALSRKQQMDILALIRSGEISAAPLAVDRVPDVAAALTYEDWVTGLEEPWAIAFTGADDAFITEKKGTLHMVRSGVLSDAPVAGIPEVVSAGQGGLLDVALDPDYAENGWVYLAFSHPKRPGASAAMTKIIRGRIAGNSWTDAQTLFEAKPEHYIRSRVHYGGRITFDKDGFLYFSIGERGQKDHAQDITRPNGKIHRIHRDGRIPADNPFIETPGAYPSIYSYGNRNPQGLIIHPETGVLWETEHGPKGGDELNVITKGVNYGWPEISYGRNYSGTELTPYTALPGMAQPASHWTPSIAVCGLDVYTGDLFPDWRGRLLAGSLKNQSVRLIDVDGEDYLSEAVLFKDMGRVRDVTTGPDGAIYAALPGKIIRVSPSYE